MRKKLFILTFFALIAAEARASGLYYGDVLCKSTDCYLVEKKGSLGEIKFHLMDSRGKSPWKGASYDSNYVKIIGIEDNGKLRVFGVTLHIPDQRIMANAAKEEQ